MRSVSLKEIDRWIWDYKVCLDKCLSIVCTAHFDLYHLPLLHLSPSLSHFDLSNLLFLHLSSSSSPPLFLFLSPRPSLCQSLPRIFSLSLLLAAALSLSPPVYARWHYNTLQIAAARCSTLQHTATRCNTLQHSATLCNTLQPTATRCNTLQHTATRCNTLQHAATLYNTLPHTATHCNTLHLAASHSNTLQHTCIYVHTYVCVCVCEHVRVYIYFYTYIYVCGRMYKMVCMVVNSMYALSHEAHTCYASLICIYHAASLNASWRTSEWVMAHIWMSHGTHMNESTPMHLSWHISKWVMAYMYVHIYICTYTCIYVYLWVCVNIYIYICTCTYLGTSKELSIHVYVYIKWMYACIYLHTHICVYLQICI